jgi:NADH-quinone oxidoreductase subunit J
MMTALFFILSVVCVASVLGMILSKNQAYNALFLVLAFSCLGGLFGLLGAPFMAVVQIIIYAGAIMVLFIFVIMMINLREGISPEKKKRTLVFAGFIAVFLLAELLIAAKSGLGGLEVAAGATGSSPTEIGRLLFTKYLYPFEITSVLIIAALVGAIVLAKKKEKA